MNKGDTNWRSVERLATLCIVRDEIGYAEKTEPPASYALSYSTASPQSDFIVAASAVPFGVLMDVLDEHMLGIKLAYPKEYDKVVKQLENMARDKEAT